MKFICTEKDHQEIKKEGFNRGFAEAERILRGLLNGEPLFVSQGEDEFGMLKSRRLGDREDDKNNVWHDLQQKLRV